MDTELLQLLVNSSGAALVAAMFIWYLVRRDKEFAQSLKDVNEIMSKHSQADLDIQSRLVESLDQLTERINSSIVYNKKIDRKKQKNDSRE